MTHFFKIFLDLLIEDRYFINNKTVVHIMKKVIQEKGGT